MSSEQPRPRTQVANTTLSYLGQGVAEPRHPALVAFLAHWRASGEQGQLPSRSSFDPRKIKPWLTRSFLASPDGDTFRYRVFGSALEHRLEVFAHRRTVRDVWPDDTASRTEGWFSRAIGSREPIVLNGRMKGLQAAQVGFECLIAPIASSKGDAWVIGCLCADDEGA